MANRPDRSAQKLNANLRQSVSSARTLTFVLSGIPGPMNSAANAAGQLAENIAKASKSARIAASATGIGAVIAGIVTLGGALFGMKKHASDVAKEIAEVNRETRILNAQADGNKRVAGELQIADAMERELQAAKGLENLLQKFPELQDAIRGKAEAARRALIADLNRNANERVIDLRHDAGEIRSGLKGDRERRMAAAGNERARMLAETLRNEEGLSRERIVAWQEAIESRYNATVAEIEQDTIRPGGDQLGRSLASALADGIAEGIRSGDITAGFSALGGAVLIGFGSLMQEIGTQAILAQGLFDNLMASLFQFAGSGIPAAVALVAAGGVLKGLGAAMGGGRSRRVGGGGGFASTGFGGSTTTFVDRGLINPAVPLSGPALGSARTPVNLTAVFFGAPEDPRVQRHLLETLDLAQRRRG